MINEILNVFLLNNSLQVINRCTSLKISNANLNLSMLKKAKHSFLKEILSSWKIQQLMMQKISSLKEKESTHILDRECNLYGNSGTVSNMFLTCPADIYLHN